MQKTWVRAVTTLLTLGVMLMIFMFSTEKAEKSDATSGVVAEWVAEKIEPEYKKMPEPQKTSFFKEVQYIVRKCAHFTEFALLGCSMRLCLESWFGALDKNPGKRRKKFWLLALLAWLGGTGYAALDEIHQTMVDGRTGRPLDVLIDSSGVLTGTLITLLALWFFLYRRKNADFLRAFGS